MSVPDNHYLFSFIQQIQQLGELSFASMDAHNHAIESSLFLGPNQYGKNRTTRLNRGHHGVQNRGHHWTPVDWELFGRLPMVSPVLRCADACPWCPRFCGVRTLAHGVPGFRIIEQGLLSQMPLRLGDRLLSPDFPDWPSFHRGVGFVLANLISRCPLRRPSHGTLR